MASSDSDRLPLIGLTTYIETARWGAWEQPAALLPHQYVRAVRDGGGPPVRTSPSRRSRTDAPARYGQDAHAESGAPRGRWRAAACYG